MPKKSSKSAKYWKKHIISWERSAYYKDFNEKADFWDGLSILFRGTAMSSRMEIALQKLKPFLKQRIVLDAGSASGRFAHKMIKEGASKVIGIDISQEAVKTNDELQKTKKVELYVDDLIYPTKP